MIIPHELLLTLKEWKGFGAKNIQAVAEHLATIGSAAPGREEYYDVIADILSCGKLSRIKNMPSVQAFSEANGRARRIISAAENLGIGIISRYDEEFPKNLLGTLNEDGNPDVPVILYYKGDLKAAGLPSVAIIGTREPSREGNIAGQYLGTAFAQAGFNIVSGLALGCDTAAHVGSLRASKGATTAFLAHGLDTIYPEENRGLAEVIIERGGLLMSEYPAGAKVDRYKFVARDRLQAGLADATIVIQSGIHGGTMHAVNATLKAGKPLFAVSYIGSSIAPDTISANTTLISTGEASPLGRNDVPAIIKILADRKDSSSSPVRQEPIIQEPSLFD